MAIDDELLKNYIKTKELESTADSNDMLSALKYASMIRLGIGVQRQAQLGESGYDVAAKAIDETASAASDLMTGYAKIATATGTTKKDKIKLMKDAQSIWESYFYQRDAVTGGLKLKRTDLMTAGIEPPSQELFKNQILTESLLLGDEGFTDKLISTHVTEVKKARAASVKEPTWEDTIQRYQLGRAIAQGRK